LPLLPLPLQVITPLPSCRKLVIEALNGGAGVVVPPPEAGGVVAGTSGLDEELPEAVLPDGEVDVVLEAVGLLELEVKVVEVLLTDF
jgi:hypothetical protein